MGNCTSSQLQHPIITNNNYILFETCNDQTKERIFEIMDQRIREEIKKDQYNNEFCLKTFFLPDKVSEEALYTYYDVYPNIETREKDEETSTKKDIYVNYTIIFERMKRFIDYSYIVSHSYWYMFHDVFDNKHKYLHSITEPFQYQTIGEISYKWYGLLHITRVHSSIPTSVSNEKTSDLTNIIVTIE